MPPASGLEQLNEGTEPPDLAPGAPPPPAVETIALCSAWAVPTQSSPAASTSCRRDARRGIRGSSPVGALEDALDIPM